MTNRDKRKLSVPFLPAGRISSRIASFALGIAAFAGMCNANLITVYFDPSQPAPAGETGNAPAAETANNNFSLWGVQYQLTGGDNTGCGLFGGNSLCFGDMIGTAALDLSLLSDPVLSGPLVPGVTLTLTFAVSTTNLDFSAAVGTLLDTTGCPQTAASYTNLTPDCPANVGLFDANGSLITTGTYQWTLPDDSFITEGAFAYTGAAIRQAVITFPEADSSYTEFAIDNLTYQTNSAPAAPEPPSSLLLGVAMIAFGYHRSPRLAGRLFKSTNTHQR